MNANFQNYVTSQAFVLVLSRPQVDALYWIAYQGTKARIASIPYMVSVQSLARKGLVHREAWRLDNPWRLTEEGKLTLDLCKRAGLFQSHKPIKKAA